MVGVQHSLLVVTSRAACLSRFALIKDKGSLIGCRCAALMSVTTPPPPPFSSLEKTHCRCTSAHLSFDALQHPPPLTSPLPSFRPVTHPQGSHAHTSLTRHTSHAATLWGTKVTSVCFLLNEIVFPVLIQLCWLTPAAQDTIQTPPTGGGGAFHAG